MYVSPMVAQGFRSFNFKFKHYSELSIHMLISAYKRNLPHQLKDRIFDPPAFIKWV